MAGAPTVEGIVAVLQGTIAEGSLADSLLNYLSAGLGLNLGLGGLVFDFTSLFGPGDPSAECS
jgi:hypothetical protein